MAGIERAREIRRRRKRKQQVVRWKRRAATATNSEKLEIVRKLRRLTPGAATIISQLDLPVR
jgi:hypothetical protein